jgi:signal transduction histidine kinase
MKRKRGETARDRRHLGLGLYIVEKIASAHGGSVDVQSTQQEGTMVTLRLPRR